MKIKTFFIKFSKTTTVWNICVSLPYPPTGGDFSLCALSSSICGAFTIYVYFDALAFGMTAVVLQIL